MDIVLSIQLKTARLLNFIWQKKCYLFNLLWTFAARICEEFFYFARFAFDTTSTGWDCGLTLSQGGIKCGNRGTGFLDSEGSHR